MGWRRLSTAAGPSQCQGRQPASGRIKRGGSRTGKHLPHDGCTVLVMRRTATHLFVGVGLLAAMLATASTARAAGNIVIAISPASVAVGQPVEVLVRTFRVVERSGLSLPFESPVAPNPLPSDVWNILYTWADYPFDVVAQHEDGTEVPLTLARDPTDATLWRGVVSLPKSGTWTIWVRNFQHKEPGSTAVVSVRHGGPPSTGEAPAIEAGPAAVIGVLLGLLGAAVIGHVWNVVRHPDPG